MKKIIALVTLILTAISSQAAGRRYKGDLNGDDKVDLADMVFLAKAIQAGSADKSYDVNLSGKVDDYDLHALANIILSGKLVEDSGFNVGIGGWNDTGEDFGGTVNAPAFRGTRSAESTRFYIANPKKDGGRYSIDFGIEEGDVVPSAILFNITIPRDLSFDGDNVIILDNGILDGHKLYGNPKVETPDEWSDKIIRFIVFSSEMNPFKSSVGKIGTISYSCVECLWRSYQFEDCQIAMSDSEAIILPDPSNKYIYWTPVPVSDISLSYSQVDIKVGGEKEIWAGVGPWEATDKTLTWKSSDESVAIVSYVSEDSHMVRVMAVSPGTAIITATTGNGVVATCKVNVSAVLVESIQILGLPDGWIEVGDKFRLTAVVYPDNATDKSVNWSTTAPEVATVDQDGNVEVVSVGTATIVATAMDAGKYQAFVTIDAVADVAAIDTDPGPFRVFDIHGRFVRTADSPDSIKSLSPGVYIVRTPTNTYKITH